MYSKEAVTIIKIYTDNQKYNSVSDSFNFRLIIFYNICKRSGLPLKGYITAFPIIIAVFLLSNLTPRIPIYKTSLKDLSTTKKTLLSRMQLAYKELLIITQRSQFTSTYSCLLISFVSNNM